MIEYTQINYKWDLSYFCIAIEHARRTDSLKGHYLIQDLDAYSLYLPTGQMVQGSSFLSIEILSK